MKMVLTPRKAKKKHLCSKCRKEIVPDEDYVELKIHGLDRIPPAYKYCMEDGVQIKKVLEETMKPALVELNKVLGFNYKF